MGLLEGIEYLTCAVEAGSLAAAARRLRVTPSAVSRRITWLERELGVALTARTTRSLRLTDDGQAFYQRSVRILEQLGEARDAIARVKQEPTGILRVDAPVALGRSVLAPLLPRFLARHPKLQLDLTLRDQRIDPLVEGADVLIRIGQLGDLPLVARRLGESRLVFCASPAYLRAHGTPRSPDDIPRHACLGYLRDGSPMAFRFVTGDQIRAVDITGPIHVNDTHTLRALALAGAGIFVAFDFLIAADLASGALVEILADHPSTTWPIHALYPRNRHLVPKVGAFLAYLEQHWPAVAPPARRKSRTDARRARGSRRGPRRRAGRPTRR